MATAKGGAPGRKAWEPRYTTSEIRERVMREVSRRFPVDEQTGTKEPDLLGTKEIADRIGMSRDDWYKRTTQERTPFTVRELGAIAEILGAPRLWPFAEWDELCDRFGPGKGGR